MLWRRKCRCLVFYPLSFSIVSIKNDCEAPEPWERTNERKLRRFNFTLSSSAAHILSPRGHITLACLQWVDCFCSTWEYEAHMHKCASRLMSQARKKIVSKKISQDRIASVISLLRGLNFFFSPSVGKLFGKQLHTQRGTTLRCPLLVFRNVVNSY